MAKVIARGYFDVVGLDQGGLACEDPSLTVQASKDECDINNIVNKYLRTGDIALLGQRQTVYADVSELGDLQDAYGRVMAAEEAFLSLPAEIRREFDNDPIKLVNFCSDPSNLPRAIELGLAPKPLEASSASSPAGQAGKAGTEPA